MGSRRNRPRTAASYISPGVYVEEVPYDARPLEAVGTAVAAFVGFVERRPVAAAVGLATVLGIVVALVRRRRC